VSKLIEKLMVPMRKEDLSEVIAIEATLYSHPWSYKNFSDSLDAGYFCNILQIGHQICGYMVAMSGVAESHLLNISVAKHWQRQGLASYMLQFMEQWSQQQRAERIWLEVRESNLSAIELYQRSGFCRIGIRRGYYPYLLNQREDAVVMCKNTASGEST